jgi:hypothetical protein
VLALVGGGLLLIPLDHAPRVYVQSYISATLL